MHRKLAIGGAVLVAMLAFAGRAFADTTTPVQLTFDHMVLVTPDLTAQVVSPTTQPLTVTADVDTTTGAFTIAQSDFSAPTYSFTSPVAGTAQVALAAPATGQLDPTTGAVEITGNFQSTITITGEGSCVVDTGTITLSTATTKPYPGQDFPAGETGAITGDGAFGTGWSTLPPGTGSACTLVNPAVDGTGGIWISRGISPTTTTTTAPKLKLTVAKPKSIKAGKSASVSATLSNTGGADTSSVKVCLAAKKLSPASSCKTVKNPAAGAIDKLTFKVKAKKAGSYKLTVSATGLSSKSVTLKVTK